ncbi:MAG: hypothetical protein EOO03_02810 [Chitinophagaceae bacterium]|nr:MAG: hypothetical protein EOO03_02810 [Chitinophagaceae bacterium]
MQQRILFTVFFLLATVLVFAQAEITKPAFEKTIQDFGAVANDEVDDSWAFIKAGKYFSNLWDINGVPLKKGQVNFSYSKYSGKLLIPSGKYLVGKQIDIPSTGLTTTYGKVFGNPAATAPLRFDAGGAFKAGFELMRIENINQFQVIGTGAKAPVIQYNKGLLIGHFNSKGKPVWYPESLYEGKHAVHIGNFMDAVNCQNVLMQNIIIEGNNFDSKGNTTYNGGWQGDGIQIGASGAYFLNTKNVSIIKMNVQHMTLDGLIFQDYYRDTTKFPGQANSNLYIADSKFDYNRRQGFSWVGGRKIRVVNSSFSNTGTTIGNTGVARGNPGAGVDIEPESDGSNPLFCIDAVFTNCSFINNAGLALVNDVTAGRSKLVTFENSIFHDVDGYSVWVKGRAFTFKNCKIWGGFVYGNEGLVAGEETKFYDCDFADEEIPSRPGVHNKGFALVESWSVARRLSFINCSFRTLHKGQRLLAIFSPDKDESNFSQFTNCSFNSAFGGAANVLFGATFNGNTQIVNRGSQVETYSLNGFIAKGSDAAAKPFTFDVDGKVLLAPANSNGPGLTQFVIGRSQYGTANKGYLNFTIGKESCLYGYWNQNLDVGENSVFTNNGQFALLSGNINLDGKLKLKGGSNTAFFNAVKINSKYEQGGEFLYDPASRFGVSDRWKKQLEGLGTGLPISGIKVPQKIKFKKASQ